MKFPKRNLPLSEFENTAKVPAHYELADSAAGDHLPVRDTGLDKDLPDTTKAHLFIERDHGYLGMEKDDFDAIFSCKP